MDNLAALRDEYVRDGIGSLLHELLSKVVWSTVHQYPPAEYSAYQNWDKPACDDVLNEWIAERLWGRADLYVMLTAAPNVAQLRAALTTSLRQFLSNHRRRSIASNLYKRISKILREDSQFTSDGVANAATEKRWKIADSNGRPSCLSIDELVQISFDLSDDELEVVKYGPFSLKLSPILRDPKLREFLRFLLQKADGSLTVTDIVEVMKFRFTLPVEGDTTVEESLPSSNPSPETEASVSVAARSIVARLGFEGCKIVAAYFLAGGDFNASAMKCQTDSESVREVVHRAFAAICECSESEENAQSIMNQVESLLIQTGR